MITSIVLSILGLLMGLIFIVGVFGNDDDNPVDHATPLIAILLDLILLVFVIGIYQVSTNYLTTWMNNGYVEYTTTKYNPDESSVTYDNVEYNVTSVTDKSNDAKDVKYDIKIQKQIAKKSLWSPTLFKSERTKVTVTIVPK